MKAAKHGSMPPITPDLVLRANELYHDLEQHEYAGRHPEIFDAEAARWARLAALVFGNGERRALRVMDIGTGTGFVPRQLLPWLTSGDELICTDISSRMLDVCRDQLSQPPTRCSLRYVKLNGLTLPAGDGAIDVITLNSVLHHLPDLAAFFREVRRVLAPGGFFAFAHEPNRDFYRDRGAMLRYRLALVMLAPKQAAGALLRALGMMESTLALTRRFRARAADTMLQNLNATLHLEGLIDAPLTNDQLTALVDFHSPTAGGLRHGLGIDAKDILHRYLPGFSLVTMELYNPLGDRIPAAAPWEVLWHRLLRRKSPRLGATVAAVFRRDV